MRARIHIYVWGVFGVLPLVTGGAWSGRPGAAEPAAARDQEVWREECGSCHLAYPARFLPQASWEEVMRTLDDHFGADASVSEATAASISRYLRSAARSGSRSQSGPVVQRITDTRWFVHEHDELRATTFRSRQVRSAANCGACHTDADAGRFSEHALKVPK
jgi:nitrate/TMAO reductase-like tetraheme cytochrome c subunit